MVEDGDEERVKYFVDGNDLTLIFSSEMLLDVSAKMKISLMKRSKR